MNWKPDINLLIFLSAAFVLGLALGAFYFAVLWQTVKRLSVTASPARLMIGSFVSRLAIVLGIFYLLMNGGHWERLAAAMLGFIIVRKILTHRLGPQKAEA